MFADGARFVLLQPFVDTSRMEVVDALQIANSLVFLHLVKADAATVFGVAFEFPLRKIADFVSCCTDGDVISGLWHVERGVHSLHVTP